MSINAKLLSFCLLLSAMLFGFSWLAVEAAGRSPWTDIGPDFAATQDGLDLLHDARQRFASLDVQFGGAQLGGARRDVVLSPDEQAALSRATSAIVQRIGAANLRAASAPSTAAVGRLMVIFLPLDAARGDVSRRLLERSLGPAEQAFTEAVEAFRADADAIGAAFSARQEAHLSYDLLAIVAIAMIVLLGVVWVTMSVSNGLGKARAIAEGLAAGRRDIDIPRQSTAEFEALFTALRRLGRNVVEHDRQNERRMMLQATSFDTTIETQHHRFVAAVNNMSQGLCMLDKDLNLIAFNVPFSVLFPHLEQGASGEELQCDPRFYIFLAAHDTGTFVHETADGQMLEVKRRGVRGGGLVMTFEDITDQYRTSQALEHLASHDGLTDLPNRRLFRERLEACFGEAERGRSLAVFAIDLNGFKQVNDTFGHPLGDALLRAVGERLKACVTARDVVARLGGDEFAILQLEESQPDAASRLGAALIGAFAQPFEIERRTIDVGVSIGAASLGQNALRQASADLAMQNCDLALYSAKSETGSAFRLYVPSMRDELEERRALDHDLRTALERGELELFYQPFVDADRRGVSGFEALLRWRHPVRGMVSPGIFIPIAEELGLIDAIGIFALRKACEAAAGWPSGLTISVNLSPFQFRNPALVEEVAKALLRSGLDARRLQLEVTESLFLDNAETVLATLTGLRQLGSVISMDDFGTGYSSLGYLTRFPFDKIKIDQSFVRDIEKPQSMAVIRAVIGLSRSMNMAVIAEGIETAEQYRMLHHEGCREMQGYLFSAPRPASDLPNLLTQIPARWAALTGTGPSARKSRAA